MRLALRLAGMMVWLTMRAGAVETVLPIYIEDNHAGSFHWLASWLDLDEECTLIHIDAHSDASGVFESDKLRQQLRRVSSITERLDLLETWRSAGNVQCFDWIEPLMPLPFSTVIWVPVKSLSAAEAKRLEQEAVEALDGHLEVAPRQAGSLHGRYHVLGLQDLAANLEKQENAKPLVATIDLDTFSGMEPSEQALAFERIWSFVSERQNLKAITFSISRPYLAGDEEAQRLLTLALEAALSLPTAQIHFEPFAIIGNDRSQQARDLRKAGKAVPTYDVTRAPAALRALFLVNSQRITVQHDSARWTTLLKQWESEAPLFSLILADRSISDDGIWRVPVSEDTTIKLQSEPQSDTSTIDKIEWLALVPQYAQCNLMGSSGRRFGFATDAPARPRWRAIALTNEASDLHNSDGRTLSLDRLKPFFDSTFGYGSVRVKARVYGRSGVVRETDAMAIRRFSGTGFRAAITEQFGLPYLFGSGTLRSGTKTGPETGWGSDCANFIIYALRRNGHRIPWGDPKALRRFLNPVAAPGRPGETPFTPDDLENGLIIHLGNHVAALMEDRPPLGILDGGDQVAHHLEGMPEVISLRELLDARKKSSFDVFKAPSIPAKTLK